MPTRIALDPQLDVSATEFVSAWNATPPVEDAPASLADSTAESFLSPELTVALISTAASVPASIIAAFVTEYLKKKFIEKDTPKVTVTTISTPDGEPVLIIKQTEE